MQQQTIDRLIVAQQRIEAILVQNYELHEYPIPRLFAILPDSYEKWDPRNFMVERFRLFFELRLSVQELVGEGVPRIDQAIDSLSKLKVLHRYNLYPAIWFRGSGKLSTRSPYGSIALQELVEFGRFFYGSGSVRERAIARSLPTLEVLLLNLDLSDYGNLSMSGLFSVLFSITNTGNHLLFSRLMRLELSVPLSQDSFQRSILPSTSLSGPFRRR